MPAPGPIPIAAVRRFNRFYTQRIGVLHEGLLESQYSLTEVRVLYELAHRERPTATALAEHLGLDPGYLSRILRTFRLRGLTGRTRSATDGRQSILRLTAKGRRAFAQLDARSNRQVSALLGSLAGPDQERLIEAMEAIEGLLGAEKPVSRATPYRLRPPRSGDMGWVVHRHGVLYGREWGYDEQFEALVAGIVARFVQNFDPARERCWIAEKDGAVVGSVFLVRKSARVAKLRLLYVEPEARGLGIGKRLVDECIRFAREAGYRKMALWTQSTLVAARGVYEQAGFRRVAEEPHHSFGQDLVAETWELDL
jgi:DNA-binding MarR family transcriptional regulator/GNAT superfamily N-acetyltransferase